MVNALEVFHQLAAAADPGKAFQHRHQISNTDGALFGQLTRLMQMFVHLHIGGGLHAVVQAGMSPPRDPDIEGDVGDQTEENAVA